MAKTSAKNKKSASGQRKVECIIQQLNQYESEQDNRGSVKLLPNSRNFIIATDHNISRGSQSNIVKSRVSQNVFSYLYLPIGKF